MFPIASMTGLEPVTFGLHRADVLPIELHGTHLITFRYTLERPLGHSIPAEKELDCTPNGI